MITKNYYEIYMMKLFGDVRSGNCYKVQLTCALLDISYEYIAIDILAGDTKTPEFLARSSVGQIPIVALDDGTILRESNAILYYLAQGSSLFPEDIVHQTQVLSWQYFEQYSHEPYIAVARFIQLYLGLPEDKRAEFEAKQIGGNNALMIMNEHLAHHNYFVGGALSIADISLFAYTHKAAEGGFNLAEYPYIKQWIKRIESEARFIPMG